MKKRLHTVAPKRVGLTRQCEAANEADRQCDPLRALLRAGLESGPGIPVTPRYWAQKRKALRRRSRRPQ